MKRIIRQIRSNLKALQAPWPYRPYMNRHKLIFIHVPRAAASSIRTALGAPPTGRDHLEWHIYQAANPEKIQAVLQVRLCEKPF